MAYFSNSSESMNYEGKYCDRCVHNKNCAVMGAHFMYNYDDCNNDESILHILIPRDGNHNKECAMFIEKPKEIKRL